MIALIATILPCVTILIVAVLVIRERAMQRDPGKVRRAKGALEAEKLRTLMEVEEWKRDWIIDQRHKGAPPALPPGTMTILDKERP